MKDDYCENCPMHYLECDYWGEWNEGCSAGLDGWFDGKYSLICKMPKIVKKVYLKYRVMLILPIKKKWFDMILSGEKILDKNKEKKQKEFRTEELMNNISTKTKELIEKLTEEEIDEIYRYAKCKSIAEDVKSYAEDNNIEISDADVYKAASLWVYHGLHNCEATYWDNIHAVISEVTNLE